MGLSVISICILLIVTNFELLFICITVKSELSFHILGSFSIQQIASFIDQRMFLYRFKKLVHFTVMSCIFFVVCHLPLVFLWTFFLTSIFYLVFMWLDLLSFTYGLFHSNTIQKKIISEIMNSCTFMISLLSDI